MAVLGIRFGYKMEMLSKSLPFEEEYDIIYTAQKMIIMLFSMKG